MPLAHSIEVEAFEAVVPGGVRRVTWLVRQGDDWVLASDVPGASVEAGDTGPGTVWLRRVKLELPSGARLMRVESEPRRTASRDPLDYLFAPPRDQARLTRRGAFVVGAGGKLERVVARRR